MDFVSHWIEGASRKVESERAASPWARKEGTYQYDALVPLDRRQIPHQAVRNIPCTSLSGGG